MSDWRVARSLEQLRTQVNAARPKRRKADDGTIGDADHASRNSDHNAWIIDGPFGVVSGMDLTHDPAGGMDSYKLAEVLRTKRDRRIKYVISNGKIFSSISSPWTWRPYTLRNKHDHHVHISVLSSKAMYDNINLWDLGDMFSGAPLPPEDVTDDPPILRRGDSGLWVKTLQQYLNVEDDGFFGPVTQAAVTKFQKRRGLGVDGIVGGYTWRELKAQSTADTPLNNPKMLDIVATKFGGSGDPNKSAYDGHIITDLENGVALPYRFPGERPNVKVTNCANGKSVICSIVDVGPWNISDNYWSVPNGRPQAETGRDVRGRVTNLAGIDLTPHADEAIGLGGLGRVDWEFLLPKTALLELEDDD